VTVRVKLSRAGKKKLREAKDHRVKVKVKVNFTPTGGEPQTVFKIVTFKGAGRRKH
jgi:hypothetical protein